MENINRKSESTEENPLGYFEYIYIDRNYDFILNAFKKRAEIFFGHDMIPCPYKIIYTDSEIQKYTYEFEDEIHDIIDIREFSFRISLRDEFKLVFDNYYRNIEICNSPKEINNYIDKLKLSIENIRSSYNRFFTENLNHLEVINLLKTFEDILDNKKNEILQELNLLQNNEELLDLNKDLTKQNKELQLELTQKSNITKSDKKKKNINYFKLINLENKIDIIDKLYSKEGILFTNSSVKLLESIFDKVAINPEDKIKWIYKNGKTGNGTSYMIYFFKILIKEKIIETLTAHKLNVSLASSFIDSNGKSFDYLKFKRITDKVDEYISKPKGKPIKYVKLDEIIAELAK